MDIRQLEQELGVPIVERGHRFHGLTPHGERVLKWANAILDNWTSLQQEIATLRDVSGTLVGHLSVGVIPSALPMAALITKGIQARHPGVELTVLSQSSIEILRHLEDFSIDVGLTYLDNEPIEGMRSECVYMERYCLLVRADHELAAATSVTWAVAATQPLCLLTSDMQNRRIVDRAFRAANSAPVPRLETNSVIKAYYNTFENGLDAFDDATYTTQSANGRFRSPYDDHAFGLTTEVGTQQRAQSLKFAAHYRNDVHSEQQFSRPTHPTLSSQELPQEQSQYTWSLAVEDTIHVSPTVDVVGGLSYDRYSIAKAEEFSPARGIFEYPKGGSDSVNWQTALIWRYREGSEVHASVSDRTRFPVIFELYSTRFGTATPNPDLGPERATSLELGWKGRAVRNVRLEGAVFYSDVRDLIQTVVLPDTTSQTQNVGDGRFYGAEVGIDVTAHQQLTFGGNYTALSRTIRDALLPNLRPTGVPTHKAFLYAAWQPMRRLTVTPSIDLAGDRWSDVNPAPAFPYVRTGSYTLIDLSAQYALAERFDVVFGLKNLRDENFQLAWGFPQPGRTFYVKTRVGL